MKNKNFLIGIILVAVVLVSGCAQQKLPSIKISSPTANQEISGPSLSVALNVSNFDLVDPSTVNSTKENGKGHIHVYLDDFNEQKGAKTTFAFTGISEGQHKIKAELHNHDHSLYAPEIKNEVTFTIKSGKGLLEKTSTVNKDVKIDGLPSPPPLPPLVKPKKSA